METINQLLDAKGGEVFSIGPNAPVFDALKLMADNEVGSLVVLDEGRIVGLISERDYALGTEPRHRAARALHHGLIESALWEAAAPTGQPMGGEQPERFAVHCVSPRTHHPGRGLC